MSCLQKIILEDEHSLIQFFFRPILVLTLCAIFTSLGYAGEKEKLKITGNLRNRVLYFNVREDSLLNPNNVLEIPRFGDNSRLELFLDSEASHWIKLHSAGRSYYSTLKQEKEFRSYLDETYLDINFSNRLMLRTGKQRTVWGTGMAWNPSDIINLPKDPEDPSEEKEGVLSAKMDIPLGNKCGLLQNPVFTTIFVPKVTGSDVFETNRNQAVAKMYFLLKGFDLHLISSFTEDKKPVFGLSTAGVVFDVLELHGEAVFQKGTERYYVTSNDRLSQSKLNSDDVFSKWLVGTRYTLPGDVIFLAEFYHIDEGYNNSGMQNYLNLVSKDRSKLSLLPQRDLRKNYIFVNLSKSNLWDTFNVNSRILGNLDDSSIMWVPRVEYTRINNLTLAMEPYFFWGGKKSEFGNASTDFFIRFETTLHF